MTDSPLVSIVIPVYNAERYICETVASVLNQTYGNVECIVVDDGSTDDSVSVLDVYSNRIKIIRQKNSGQSTALNVGFRHCNGDYIGYLSADDMLDSTCVFDLVTAIRNDFHQNDRPIVIFPKYRTIDRDGYVINHQVTSFRGINHMINSFKCTIGPGALFDRTLLLNAGGWNPAYKQIPDYVFWVMLSPVSAFRQLDKVLSSFRVHENSQTHSKSSIKKSDESVVFAKYAIEVQKLIPNNSISSFISSAYLFSACLHMRARRYLLGIQRWIIAVYYKPTRALGIDALKMLLSNIFASLA